MITFISPTLKRAALLVTLCFFAVAFPVLAQNTPLVAFINSGGQLIVSSGDGSFRWIVTNPGENLIGNFVWSSRGDQLLFAVNANGTISLRAASIPQQVVSEVGVATEVVLSLSPNGAYTFMSETGGVYYLEAQGVSIPLPLTNDPTARYSWLWADALPLVAYWGYAENSALAVTNATRGETALIDSGRTSPILPLLWRDGTAQLIYRDADGQLRLADFSCLQSSCSAIPADQSVVLASSDIDIAADDTHLYFRSGDSIAAVALACATSDNCLSSAVVIAPNAAPQTAISAKNGILLYTAYTQNPNDPNDREARAVNLACLTSGGCTAQTIAPSSIAGALSSNGRFAVIESANGLESLDLTTGARAYLSERGAPLSRARWQP